MSTSANKGTKNSTRKRFSDGQIKSLETTFVSESRPELQLKQHLAHKLGLQPRQVAIWFQNKRARSKSKHIEGEYNSLKSDYDNLALRFEALRKEHQSLLLQVQTLRTMAKKRDGDDNENKKKNDIVSEEPTLLLDINNSDEDRSRKAEYLKEEEGGGVFNIAEECLTSCSFQSCTFLDNTGTASLWWDF